MIALYSRYKLISNMIKTCCSAVKQERSWYVSRLEDADSGLMLCGLFINESNACAGNKTLCACEHNKGIWFMMLVSQVLLSEWSGHMSL